MIGCLKFCSDCCTSFLRIFGINSPPTFRTGVSVPRAQYNNTGGGCDESAPSGRVAGYYHKNTARGNYTFRMDTRRTTPNKTVAYLNKKIFLVSICGICATEEHPHPCKLGNLGNSVCFLTLGNCVSINIMYPQVISAIGIIYPASLSVFDLLRVLGSWG